MADHRIPLQRGCYYHIYNRGINSCPIFFEADNYVHFLRLYDRYISPIANSFAWVLMGNHFHLLVQLLPAPPPEGFENLRGVGERERRISQPFSDLFNAYTKAVNKRYHRTGSLFEHSFRRKEVTDVAYLKQLVHYIHHNPVEYPWSSYQTCVSLKPTKLRRDTVIGRFGDDAGFKVMHDSTVETEEIEKWLDL